MTEKRPADLLPSPASWLLIRTWQGRLAFRLDRRVPLTLAGLVGVTLVALVLNLGQGEYALSPLEVLRALFQPANAPADAVFIVQTLRLPRSLVAWMVGIALALSGTILQGLTRNPLAEPSIIGISAGASCIAVAFTVLLPTLPIVLLPIAAFAGALGAAILIYLLAWQGGSSPLRLILIGVGLSTVINAITNFLITLGNLDNVSQALIWLAGSVYGRNWSHVGTLLPWLLVLVPLAWLLSRELNALSFGDELARSLGSRVEWQRTILLLISVALAGAAVATTGTIGFVGLMAPHLARQWVGPNHEGLIPTAALTGGCLVLLADMAGRLVFAPLELPCGIITAVIGAPYLLYVLYRNRR